MLFHHYPPDTIVTELKTQFFTHFSKKTEKIIIDYFKGLLVTHHLDIFMSGKNLGLNGLNRKPFHFLGNNNN